MVYGRCNELVFMGINSWFINQQILIGGLEHIFIFPYIGNVIIPTDELIFSRG